MTAKEAAKLAQLIADESGGDLQFETMLPAEGSSPLVLVMHSFMSGRLYEFRGPEDWQKLKVRLYVKEALP